MTYKLNHIHLKSVAPERTAAWYGDAFGFRIQQSQVRAGGDTFIMCASADGGTTFIISSPLPGHPLPNGDANPHLGLEHFAMETSDIAADMTRLSALGAAILLEVQTAPNGMKYAFICGPDDVRIELMQFPAAAPATA